MSKQQKNNIAVEPMEVKEAALTSERKTLATAEEPITTIPTEKKQITVTEPKLSKSKPAKETVTAIPLERIQPFENHPFRVEADAAMEEAQSERRIERCARTGAASPEGRWI